ncbi:hypothetical protein ACIQGV_39770, partial [Streptomyces sp. NPDC093094]
APVESLMPLRLARYGVPLAETAPAGLAAAGIEPALIPPAAPQPQLAAAAAPAPAVQAAPAQQRPAPVPDPDQDPDQNPWLHARDPHTVEYHGGYDPDFDPELYEPPYEEFPPDEQLYGPPYGPEQAPEPSAEETGSFPVPAGPGRTRELGEGGGSPEPDEESYYLLFKQSINGSYPTPREFSGNVEAQFGQPLAPDEAKKMVSRFTNRHYAELEEEHIA